MIRKAFGMVAASMLFVAGCGDKAMTTQPPIPTSTPVPTPVPSRSSTTTPAPTPPSTKTPIPTPPATATPIPTAPSTPTPTRVFSTVAMDVTLSRLDPPAGVKHAALAAVFLREVGYRTVHLTSMRASGFYSGAVIQVAGFTPFVLAPRQTSSFTVTLTSQVDIDCHDVVFLEIDALDQPPATGGAGCETVDWPF